MDADGDLAVAWMASGVQFPGFEARVSLYDAAGVKKGDFAISPIPDSRLYEPEVTMDDSGNMAVGYLLAPQGAGSTSGYLYIQRFSATGVRQGGAVLVFPGGTDNFSIDAAPGGDFVVAYMGELDRTWLPALSIARYNAAGAPQGNRTLVTADATADYGPRVAVDADGDFVVSWSRFHNSSSNTADVYARRYLADGTSQTDEFRVNSTIASGQLFESLATSPAGDLTILYTSLDGNSVGVFARHYTLGNNDAATANGDAYTVNEDGMLVVTVSQGVLQNDREFDGDGAKSDFDGDGTPDVSDPDDDNDGVADTLDSLVGRVELKLLGIPSHGVVYLAADGSFQYTPYAGYTGLDSFTYYVVEPGNGTRSNVATVSLNVAPLAGRSSFAGQNVVIPAAVGNYTLPNWAVFTPGPGGPYSPAYTVNNISNPALFAAQPTVDAMGVLTFGAAGTAGMTTIDVTLDDGVGGSETQTFMLHVGNTASILQPVALSDGSLNIFGGLSSFDVIEASGLRPGEVAVEGSAGRWRVLGVTGDLRINTFDGGSFVDVHNLYLAGSFSFTGGAGADHILCGVNGVVSPGQHFFISTNGGGDIVDCLNTYVGGAGRIETGDGDDLVRMFDQVATPWQFVLSYSSAQASGITTGEGNDFMLVRYAFVVGNFGIVGEGGNDAVELKYSLLQLLYGDFGEGDDVLTLTSNTITGSLLLDGGNGADRLRDLGGSYSPLSSRIRWELI